MRASYVLPKPDFPNRYNQIRDILDEDSKIRHRVYELEKKQVENYKQSRSSDKTLVRGLKFSLDKYINRLANEAQGIIDENYNDVENQNSGKLIPNYNELISFLNIYIQNGQVDQKSINDVYSKLDKLLPNLEAVVGVAQTEEFSDLDEITEVYENIKNKNYVEIGYKVPQNLFEIDQTPFVDLLEEYQRIYQFVRNGEANFLSVRDRNQVASQAQNLDEIINEIQGNPVTAEMRKRATRILGTAEAFLNRIRNYEIAPEERALLGGARLGHSKKHITNKIYKTMDDDQIQQKYNFANTNPRIESGSRIFHIRFNDTGNESYRK
jgi:hypothetical protein